MNKLQQAVINQLGFDELDDDCKSTLSDIANHGINGGFSGFIYYSDTVKFFDDNRDLILTELAEFGESIDESVPDMVKGFNCLQLSNGESWNKEIDQVLMGLDCEDDVTVKNALTWWAGEHVAFELEE